MRRTILLLAFVFASVALAPDDDEALRRFLASGFRSFPADTNETFLSNWTRAVREARTLAANRRTYEEFYEGLVGGLRGAVDAVNEPARNLPPSHHYGRNTRSTDFYEIPTLPHLTETNRRFAELAAAEGAREVTDEDGRFLFWLPAKVSLPDARGRALPIRTVDITVGIVGPTKPFAQSHPQVTVSYPKTTGPQRAAVQRELIRLYAVSIDDKKPAEARKDAAYEMAWWILATMWVEKGNSSLAKGFIASLTGDSYAVEGTGDDIDLIAFRTTPSTFRAAVQKRFGAAVPCGDCACRYRRLAP